MEQVSLQSGGCLECTVLAGGGGMVVGVFKLAQGGAANGGIWIMCGLRLV